MVGASHFFDDDPQSIAEFAVHGVKRLGEIDKGLGYVEVTVLFSGLLHKLSDGKDHIRRATVSSKSALRFWEHCLCYGSRDMPTNVS